MKNKILTFLIKTGSVTVPPQAMLEPQAKGKLNNADPVFFKNGISFIVDFLH